MLVAGKENVQMFRLLALKGALKLECLGMKHSQGSVYALIKREFGLKGSKQKVLDQFTQMIEEMIQQKEQAQQ